jgi:hypothetical protein
VQESERSAGTLCHPPQKEGLAEPGFTDEKADAGDIGQSIGQADPGATAIGGLLLSSFCDGVLDVEGKTR